MTLDSRQRGEWEQTPWIFRLLGLPMYRRSIFADWRVGGGWDGFEYTSLASPAPKGET